MDFSFSPSHELLRQVVRDFAQQEILLRTAEIEEAKHIPRDLVQKMAQLGLLGVPFPIQYGGAGAGEIGYCILMEELGKVSTSVAALVGAHIGIGSMAIYLDGSEEQKRKYLTPLTRGEKIAAFSLTEPHAGSDAAAIRLSARREGNHFVLNGSKIWVTNGPIADVVTVFAATDPSLGPRGGITAFILEKDTPGFSVGKIDEKMGILASETGELVFEDCRVPADNVLGQVGQGFLTAMKALDVGRLGLGAASLGGAQAALEACARYAALREQFGTPIAQKQAVQFMIADSLAEIEALRSLIYRTAWMVDTQQDFTRLSAICKLFGSEAASRVADRAVQIHGALGYLRDYPVERMYRDARIGEIFEGTNEIQRIIIAADLFQEYGVRVNP
ncbi:MAG: acyl-CoA dehydrogenase family protein [Chloroflexi bacterium]|nr:acyl-CoA dehydrogenase family protein [Chloroflexota bacterium]